MHIFTAELQPATNWVDWSLGEPIHGGYDPDELIYTKCCRKNQAAKDCVVQCYYDELAVWCAPGKGCKDPKAIEEHKARVSENRSAAQKRRHDAIRKEKQ